MKKIAIPYSVTGFALGVTLIALGIYLAKLDLLGNFTQGLEGSGSAGLVLYIVLFLPILLIQFLFFGCIILGIPYLLWAGFALARALQSDPDSLKRNSFAVTVYNTLILATVLTADLIIFQTVYKSDGGAPMPCIVFTVLLSTLSAVLEILSILTGKKAKKTITEQWRSR